MLHFKKKYNARIGMAFILLFLFSPLPVWAEAVAVVYPDIREPYLSVFKEIIAGVDSSVGKLKTFRINKNATEQDLQDWIQKKNINKVIALGNKGLQYAKKLPDESSIVAGAILLPPSSRDRPLSGITLSPSPEKLFSRLRQFSGKVKTITVVYSEKNNAWLIEYAKKAAAAKQFELRALPASNLAEAANLYRNLLKEPLDETHSIWLLQDKLTVDSKTMLPTILNQAWKKKFIVFSSNPAYVKRGILFSLFPDNKAMGNSLGKMAVNYSTNSSVKKSLFLPLSDLKIAVNVRAAEHLGLVLEKSQKRSFDLVFPPQR